MRLKGYTLPPRRLALAPRPVGFRRQVMSRSWQTSFRRVANIQVSLRSRDARYCTAQDLDRNNSQRYRFCPPARSLTLCDQVEGLNRPNGKPLQDWRLELQRNPPWLTVVLPVRLGLRRQPKTLRLKSRLLAP